MKSLSAVKSPRVKPPRQTSIVQSLGTGAVSVVKDLSLRPLVQIDVRSVENVKREAPGIVAAFALNSAAPSFAGIQVA